MHSELKAIIYGVPNSENFWPRGGSEPKFTFVAWSDNVKYKKGLIVLPHALRFQLLRSGRSKELRQFTI